MSHSYLPSGCALGLSQRDRHTTISDPSVPPLLVTRRGPKTNRATQLQPSPNAGLSVFEPSAAVGQATPSLHFTGSTAAPRPVQAMALPIAAAAAPAPAVPASPAVQDLLQQLTDIEQNYAANARAAQLQVVFPQMTAAAMDGTNIRPVLSRVYQLTSAAAAAMAAAGAPAPAPAPFPASALSFEHMQGVMQQLSVLGQAEDLNTGMQIVARATAANAPGDAPVPRL